MSEERRISRRRVLKVGGVAGLPAVTLLSGCTERDASSHPVRSPDTAVPETLLPRGTDTPSETPGSETESPTRNPTETEEPTETETEEPTATETETGTETQTETPQPDGYVRPSGSPRSVPSALDCADDSFERHAQYFDERELRWGSDGEDVLELRVDDLQYRLGDEFVVTLTNVSDGDQGTADRHHYNVQLYTEAGWQDVRGSPDGSPMRYSAVGVGHPPGEVYEWRLRLTERGLVESGHVNEDRLVVCPDLQPGRYRFAYWNANGDPVAVAFDVV